MCAFNGGGGREEDSGLEPLEARRSHKEQRARRDAVYCCPLLHLPPTPLGVAGPFARVRASCSRPSPGHRANPGTGRSLRHT